MWWRNEDLKVWYYEEKRGKNWYLIDEWYKVEVNCGEASISALRLMAIEVGYIPWVSKEQYYKDNEQKRRVARIKAAVKRKEMRMDGIISKRRNNDYIMRRV